MTASLILAATLVAQIGSEPNYGKGWLQPTPPSAAQRRLNAQPWDARRTKYWRHNVRAKSYFQYRLTPREAVWFMWSHPDLYKRHEIR